MKTVALAFVERAKTPPHSCKRRIPMKKLFLSVLAIALMLTSFTLVSSAGEAYTIPQCAVPPTIDGKMSKNEWYGAYHKFMNNEKGNYDYSDNPSPDVEDKANQCKGFDIYMYWYDDPNESGKLLDVKKGGLYICVVAQDKTYGTIFNDGEASNASDCFQLAIDPFNYRLSNSKKAFIFDFSPETTKKGTALIFEHYQFKSKPFLPSVCRPHCLYRSPYRAERYRANARKFQGLSKSRISYKTNLTNFSRGKSLIVKTFPLNYSYFSTSLIISRRILSFSNV